MNVPETKCQICEAPLSAGPSKAEITCRNCGFSVDVATAAIPLHACEQVIPLYDLSGSLSYSGSPLDLLQQCNRRLTPSGRLTGHIQVAPERTPVRFTERSLFRALLQSGFEVERFVKDGSRLDFRARKTGEIDEASRRFVRFRSDSNLAADVKFERMIMGSPAGSILCSVIIPTMGRGREKHMSALLRQLKQQDLSRFEVLVVEGEKRQGRAINSAVEMAQSDVIVTLDDDSEIPAPDTLRALIGALNSDENIGMVGGVNQVPATASWLIRKVMTELPRRSSPPVSVVTDSDMAEHPLLAMRKAAFIAVGGENEWIPRGLDPYLRASFRRAGYRVVVAPGVYYHHLPPGQLSKLLRQFYRNGAQSRFCSHYFPEWALDTIELHGVESSRPTPIWRRGLRLGVSLIQASLQGRWIYLACRAAYALGWLTEFRNPSLHKPKK